jgi:hypothetical protein
MSFLTLIQDSAKRLGLSNPASAYNSSDNQVIQLVALAQEEGIELAKRHPWQVLTKEKTFTGTAAAAQTGAIPDDFDRFVDESFFNRTQKHPVFGPISPQDWQFTQAVVATTLVESFRRRGNSILITPTPNGTDTYAYEYISTQWCESSGGTDQSAWAADTDTGILPEELMTLGVIWRFLRAKGFDYGEAFRTYELQVAQAFSRDGGKRTLNMGRRNHSMSRAPYVSEGSWNL